MAATGRSSSGRQRFEAGHSLFRPSHQTSGHSSSSTISCTSRTGHPLGLPAETTNDGEKPSKGGSKAGDLAISGTLRLPCQCGTITPSCSRTGHSFTSTGSYHETTKFPCSSGCWGGRSSSGVNQSRSGRRQAQGSRVARSTSARSAVRLSRSSCPASHRRWSIAACR